MTDRETLRKTLNETRKIAAFLRILGYESVRVFSNDNGLNPGYTVEGTLDGYDINVEVIGGPWEDDGTVG